MLLSRICRRLIVSMGICVTIAGCVRPSSPAPEIALRKTSSIPELADDLPLQSLASAIDEQEAILLRSTRSSLRFGVDTVPRETYIAALRQLSDLIKSGASRESVFAFINRNFDFYEVYGSDDWGEVFVTSYFEPVLEGSHKPEGRFTRALYRKPTDNVSVELPRFAERFKKEPPLVGRIEGAAVVPAFSREEIDSKNALIGRDLELCYVDPVDAFFLHIQGAGTITFTDGTEMILQYAGKNGHRYEPIGKFLRDIIPMEKMSMQAIERHLRVLSPAERQALMNRNPSYVFYQASEKRAVTSMGAAATAGRTIAADRAFFPKGALGFLSFPKPQLSASDEPEGSAEASRFVLDQDSGGAITGPGRVDLFWGRGAEARRYAGVLKGKGMLRYLAPNAEFKKALEQESGSPKM